MNSAEPTVQWLFLDLNAFFACASNRRPLPCAASQSTERRCQREHNLDPRRPNPRVPEGAYGGETVRFKTLSYS